MKIHSTYPVQIKQNARIFQDTVSIYRQSVDFFIGVCLEQWDKLRDMNGNLLRQQYVERLCHRTNANADIQYNFDKDFYKFPSYLRRSAINEAIGKVSSFRSNLANWESADPNSRGAKPGYPSAGHVYPCYYRDNMYLPGDDAYTARIKVFIRNTWDWITVNLRKSDVDYINHHCVTFTDGGGVMKYRKICAPTLQKRHKKWCLDFPVEENVTLGDTPLREQTIVAVDLGINNACTCSVIKSDGTVVGREFLCLPTENDSLTHAVNRIKKAQQHGSYKTPRLWTYARGINDDIAVKTAQFIVDTAVKYDADVIVMEHLDTRGKKRGSKKQRLHHWKSQYVQAMVEQKAHRNGIRISRVCAWNTSKLAFDGSGKVLRGKESEHTSGNYSICEFSTGKIYNCDLNASYNIGARYFVRETYKSLPAKVRLQLEAKVPSVCTRSTCTLSTLINLNAELMSLVA